MQNRFCCGLVAVLAVLAVLLPVQAMAQVVECTPARGLKPIMATHTIPPYPDVSVMTSEQGTVLLGVVIGKDGMPGDVQIEQSSGSLRLDITARVHVKANWRWEQMAEACHTKVSMRFDVHDRQPGDRWSPSIRPGIADYPPQSLKAGEQGDSIVMILLGQDGTILKVGPTGHGSGYPALDAKSEELAKTLRLKPATMDGKPVFTVVTVDFRWVLPAK